VLCPLLEITPAGDDAAAAELQSRLIAVAQRA